MLVMYVEGQHEAAAVNVRFLHTTCGNDAQHATPEGVACGRRHTARSDAGMEGTQEEE
jgi:hypothetical protein